MKLGLCSTVFIVLLIYLLVILTNLYVKVLGYIIVIGTAHVIKRMMKKSRVS